MHTFLVYFQRPAGLLPSMLAFGLLLALLFPVPTAAQTEEGMVQLNGIISDEGLPLPYSTIDIFLDNEIVESVLADNNGKFETYLELNGHFVLEFKQEGYLFKRIIFDTAVPEEQASVPQFEFEVSLYQSQLLKGSDKSVLDFPAAMIQFSPKNGAFVFNAEYTKNMQAEIEELLEKTQ